MSVNTFWIDNSCHHIESAYLETLSPCSWNKRLTISRDLAFGYILRNSTIHSFMELGVWPCCRVRVNPRLLRISINLVSLYELLAASMLHKAWGKILLTRSHTGQYQLPSGVPRQFYGQSDTQPRAVEYGAQSAPGVLSLQWWVFSSAHFPVTVACGLVSIGWALSAKGCFTGQENGQSVGWVLRWVANSTVL